MTPSIPPDPYRIHIRLLGAATLTFLIIYGVSISLHSFYNPAKHQYGTDFTAYYTAGEMARKNGNIYDYRASSIPLRPYIYPPMFAIIPMIPLSLLPHNSAVTVFCFLNLILMGWGMWLVWKVLAPANAAAPAGGLLRRPEVGCFLALAICWRFINSNMRNGNANLYIFFGLAAGLYLLVRLGTSESENHRRNSPIREFFSGILVALATTFKLTPGLFGIYYFWTFRGWAMLGGAVGLALFLGVIPSLALGVDQNWRCLKASTDNVLGKAMAEDDGGDIGMLVGRPKKAPSPDDLPRADGISFRGTFMKVLSKTDVLNRGNIDGPHNVNFVDLDIRTSKMLADICALLLLIVTVVITFPKWTRDGAIQIALCWSLTTTAMLLVAPLTRIAHAVVLLIPVSVLIALLQQDRLKGRTRTLALASLIVLALGGALTSNTVLGERLSQVVHAYGETTLGMLLIYMALAAALWSADIRVRKPLTKEIGSPV